MTVAEREAKRRYREKNRETLRAKGRVYAEQRRRAQGQAIRGSAEWLAKRGPDHYPTGAAHGNWKGDDASYSALHHWIKRWGQRTGTCSKCGGMNRRGTFRKVRTEWANISGEYRRDLNDWLELCTSCHTKLDRARGGGSLA